MVHDADEVLWGGVCLGELVVLACRWVRYSKGTALVFTIDKDIGIGKHVIQHRQTQTLTYAEVSSMTGALVITKKQ